MLAATVHCAWESPHALAGLLAAAEHQNTATPLPWSAPHGCDNESGCLCRGATQARAFDVSHCSADEATGQLFTTETDSTVLALDAGAFCRTTSVFEAPQPISGRQLRAHLASFLI